MADHRAFIGELRALAQTQLRPADDDHDDYDDDSDCNDDMEDDHDDTEGDDGKQSFQFSLNLPVFFILSTAVTALK